MLRISLQRFAQHDSVFKADALKSFLFKLGCMQERRAFLVVFAIAAALIIPAAITLRTVVHPVILQATSDNPTPLGYTWSLLLFIIPIARSVGGLAADRTCSFQERRSGERSRC